MTNSLLRSAVALTLERIRSLEPPDFEVLGRISGVSSSDIEAFIKSAGSTDQERKEAALVLKLHAKRPNPNGSRTRGRSGLAREL